MGHTDGWLVCSLSQMEFWFQQLVLSLRLLQHQVLEESGRTMKKNPHIKYTDLYN